MALDDIQPHEAPTGGHFRTDVGYMTGSQTFFRGEPLQRVTAGTISECPDTPIQTEILGIAGAGPGSAGTIWNNQAASFTWPAKSRIPVIIPTQGARFRTQNFTDDSTTFDGVPTIANIGDTCGLIQISTVWGIDQNASTVDMTCLIIDILTLDLGKSIVQVGTDTTVTAAGGFWIVFEIVAHQSMPVTGKATIPAT